MSKTSVVPPIKLSFVTVNMKSAYFHFYFAFNQVWTDKLFYSYVVPHNPRVARLAIVWPKIWKILPLSECLANKKLIWSLLKNWLLLKIWPFFGHFLYFLPKEWFWPIPKFGQFDFISPFLDKIRKWSFTKTSLFLFLATLYSLIHINFKNYTFKKKKCNIWYYRRDPLNFL